MIKSKITIEIPGNKKKGKCWAKVIKSIDYEKTDGYMFEGAFLNDGELLLEEGTVILYVGFFGSWKNGEQLAGITQIKNGREEVIIEQNQVWSERKVSLAEKCEELLNEKKQNETEPVETNQKHEPIIWTPEASTLEEFYQVAKGLNMDYVIYVQDSTGNDKSVWACAKEDFVECMFTFSNNCYFGRVQSLAVALEFGFDDQIRNN